MELGVRCNITSYFKARPPALHVFHNNKRKMPQIVQGNQGGIKNIVRPFPRPLNSRKTYPSFFLSSV